MYASLQDIIVYAIGTAAAVYIAVSLYRLFTGRRDPCASCGKECKLRSELEEIRKTKNRWNKDSLKEKRKALKEEKKKCKDPEINGSKGNCSCK